MDDVQKKDFVRSIIENKIRFVEVYIGESKHLNTVVDLFTDITMVECDRYGKPDGYPGQSVEADNPALADRFMSLLRLSINNFAELEDLPIEKVLERIFKSNFILDARKVNWESVRKQQEEWDKVLTAL